MEKTGKNTGMIDGNLLESKGFKASICPTIDYELLTDKYKILMIQEKDSWHCHIDDALCMSLVTADITSSKQLDLLMQLYE